MKYTGIECPGCSRIFGETDDIVVCPVCGTPQHRGCWNERGGCVNAEKHSADFSFEMPAVPETELVPGRADAPQTVRCPRCGAENAFGEPACGNCGERLYIAPEARQGGFAYPPADGVNPPFVPYGAPQQEYYTAPGVQPGMPEETIDGIPVSEVARFVGPSSRRYIPKFIKMEKTQRKIGWNWGAFFFGQYWMFFRKMYKTALVSLLIIFCVSFFTSSLTASYAEQLGAFANQMNAIAESAVPSVDEIMRIYEEMIDFAASSWETYFLFGVQIATNVIFGLFGNYLYKNEVTGKISALRLSVPDARTYFGLLSVKGGTSVLFVLLVLIVSSLFERVFSMI
ncbi:MAG: DUF2628 domain-containing protein [Clostridiales bacterium]|nr:DUF2628 domain-containing protein [Clostridiales bacterium]